MTTQLPLKYRRFSEEMGGKTLLPPMPKNRRPFAETVIEGFKKSGVLYSPSGLTANLLCMWLKDHNHSFTLQWDHMVSCFIVTSPSFSKRA